MKKMIADYMEKGLLENIIDMFKHDKSLFLLIGDILDDERGRVRLGIIALVEALMLGNSDDILTAIPGIVKPLKNPNPTIRGDAAYLLGIIGHINALPLLQEASEDENILVKEIVEESVKLVSPLTSLSRKT